MLTIVTFLMFAGALTAAGLAIYSTMVPALPKIQAALSGRESLPLLPPLPPRRAALPGMAITPQVETSYWRAAA